MSDATKDATTGSQSDFGTNRRNVLLSGVSMLALSAVGTTLAQAQPGPTAATAPPRSGSTPNIVVIMGDDIGIWNIGAYHRGMMSGRTPNLDNDRLRMIRLTRKWLLLGAFGRKTQRRASRALDAAERIDAATLAAKWDLRRDKAGRSES